MQRVVAAQFRRAAMDGIHKEPSPGQATILAAWHYRRDGPARAVGAQTLNLEGIFASSACSALEPKEERQWTCARSSIFGFSQRLSVSAVERLLPRDRIAS
jgi:hypothetical protein